jgi:acetyl esterase/lipase
MPPLPFPLPSPSLLLLLLGGAFALQAANALRPLRRPGVLSAASFFAGWLTDELLLHHLGWQLAAVLGLVALGALGTPLGWAGLGLAVVAWGGLLLALRRSRRTADILEQALQQGFEGHPEARAAEAQRWRVDWWRIAWVVPFRRRDVEVRRDIVFATPGGKPLKLDVYRARGAQGAAPTLLFVHGGGWVVGSKNAQGLMTVNHMASCGWTCVNITYRLSPRATFPDHLIDVKQAIRWVREQGRAHGCDPDFLVIAGGSAGAHLASLAALTPNRAEYQPGFEHVDTTVQGCVGYYGVYDFADRHRHWPHREFRLLLEWLVMKKRQRDAPEAYEAASPIAQVGPHAPPFLLFHGDHDSLAPVDEGRAFARALRAASPEPVVYAELPGAQHAFEIFPSIRSTLTMQAVERFLGALLRRRPSDVREQILEPGVQRAGDLVEARDRR